MSFTISYDCGKNWARMKKISSRRNVRKGCKRAIKKRRERRSRERRSSAKESVKGSARRWCNELFVPDLIRRRVWRSCKKKEIERRGAKRRKKEKCVHECRPYESSHVSGGRTCRRQATFAFLWHFQQVVNTVIRRNNAAKHSGRERRETFRCKSTGCIEGPVTTFASSCSGPPFRFPHFSHLNGTRAWVHLVPQRERGQTGSLILRTMSTALRLGAWSYLQCRCHCSLDCFWATLRRSLVRLCLLSDRD